MTRRDNRLRSNTLSFALQLAPDLLGSVACRLIRITVDPEVGAEVALVFTDTPADAQRLGELGAIALTANTGVVPTPYGAIGAIVWRIAADTPSETFVEQYIAPGEGTMMTLLREAAVQSHLKFIVLDNRTSEVRMLTDFENVFTLDALVEALDARAAEAKPASFNEAVQYARANAKLIDKVRAGL